MKRLGTDKHVHFVAVQIPCISFSPWINAYTRRVVLFRTLSWWKLDIFFSVQLWDLAAGKIMFEFTGHSGPVNVVEFHPNEYLLASGSSDR